MMSTTQKPAMDLQILSDLCEMHIQAALQVRESCLLAEQVAAAEEMIRNLIDMKQRIQLAKENQDVNR